MTIHLPPAWELITRLGGASVMLPLLLLVVAAQWRAGQGAATRRWLVALAAGAALVLATKIAFLSWGLGIPTLDFAGISGHATLANAIIPVWLAWVLMPRGGATARPWALSGFALGLALGALIAWSRVEVGAHSPSESAAGFLLGALIATLTLMRLNPRRPAPWPTALAGLVLLFALSPSLSTYLPTHSWEHRIAAALSPTGQLHDRAALRLAALPAH